MADEQQQNENIQSLRKAADDGVKARTEADQLRRENAMLKAGVDLESPVGKMFARAYDGELDPEMIKTGATEVGALTPAPVVAVVTEPPVVHDQTQSQERMDLASQAGKPGTIEPGDPYDAAMQAFENERRSGSTREMSAAAAFQKIVEAHKAGDGRVDA